MPFYFFFFLSFLYKNRLIFQICWTFPAKTKQNKNSFLCSVQEDIFHIQLNFGFQVKKKTKNLLLTGLQVQHKLWKHNLIYSKNWERKHRFRFDTNNCPREQADKDKEGCVSKDSALSPGNEPFGRQGQSLQQRKTF